jgi:AcrR family transcriptional regulator
MGRILASRKRDARVTFRYRRRMSEVVTRRRERTKAANRAALIEAARDAFGALGYAAVGVRDIVRRTDLAPGTFYNYFPDKEAVFRAVVAETGAEVRRRVRAAHASARTFPEFVEAGYRAYFTAIVADPATFAFVRRNLDVLGATGLEHEMPLGAAELAEDLGALVARGELSARDGDDCAPARVAVGVELGTRMAEREPPDMDGAVRFATDLFLRGVERA